MRNKDRVVEFDPIIYPTRLWVALAPSFKTLEKEFDFLDDNDEVTDAREEYENHKYAIATTFAVVQKKTLWKGCLVVVWKKSDFSVGTCAHEATHVYDWLDNELGLNCQHYDNDEPKAYYVDWVADSIDKVLKGKV